MRRQPVFPPPRIIFFYAALVVAFGVVVGKLFTLQVTSNAFYTGQAFENKASRLNDPAPRGIITDRRGVQLAINVPSYNIVVTPASLPDSEAQVNEILTHLAKLLEIPLTVPGSQPQSPCTPGRGVRDLVDEAAGFRPYEPVKIKCDIDKDIALVLREELINLPGVGVAVEPLRQYSTGALTADVIGYMAPIPDPNESEYFRFLYDYYTGRGLLPGRDRIGAAGVEAYLQDVLAGQNGSRLVEKDVAGRELRTLRVETDTVPGNNLQLTIDVRLQAAAQAAIEQRINFVNTYLARKEALAGVAIVMNPNTGEILAMVSWPTYDNNRFARGIEFEYYDQLAHDPIYPLLNHAVNILYPPGSVFKVLTASAALEENVIDPEREINDPGKITVRDAFYPNDLGRARDFVCWNREGHGPIDFVRGIAHSCNVYFYKIGGGFAEDNLEGLGIERLGKWAELFGLGQKTGVELPGELAGFIPSRDWKRITWGESWSTGDTYNAVIGQGYVHVTPLQMLNVYNVVINGGWLYRPTLVDKILDGEGNVITDTQPELLRPERIPLSDRTLDYVRTGLRMAVTEGTLEGDLNIFGEVGVPVIDVPEDLHVAGKTGTGEYCDAIAYPQNLCIPGAFPTHSWTALYAPYENPEVSVLVFIYHGGEGSRMAAPIAGNILRAYFDLKEADAESPAPAVNP